jgi:hypothetical protein
MSWSTSPAVPFVAVATGCAAFLLLLNFGPTGNIQERHIKGPSATLAVEPTRIELDGSAHAIRFFIDGKQVALLNSTGFED